MGARSRSGRTPRAAVVSATVAAVLASCSSGGPEDPTAPAPPAAVGGLGVELHVDPAGHAVQALTAARRDGDPDVAALQRLADQPTARWVTDHDPQAGYTSARELVQGASAVGETAVLVAYTLPDRDCGLYSAGGAPDDGAYYDGIGAIAAGIGDGSAIVVLEPDAVAQTFAGCAEAAAAEHRYQQLAEAVDILAARPGVRVYLDAGNPTWVQDLPGLAAALRRAGVDRAAGFALNTSNFASTETSTDYGRRLSDLLGGAHFVVDTSRNGAVVPAGTPGGTEWCNPPQARLGEPPTTATDEPRLDALLWVKQPGDSDGDCRPGDPPAGRWWHDLAVQLAS